MDNSFNSMAYFKAQEVKKMQKIVTFESNMGLALGSKHTTAASTNDLIHPGSQIQSSVLKALDLTIDFGNDDIIIPSQKKGKSFGGIFDRKQSAQ